MLLNVYCDNLMGLVIQEFVSQGQINFRIMDLVILIGIVIQMTGNRQVPLYSKWLVEPLAAITVNRVL